MLPSTTDVLIVGAGPTGLALAISLQQAGIEHALIDTLESLSQTLEAPLPDGAKWSHCARAVGTGGRGKPLTAQPGRRGARRTGCRSQSRYPAGCGVARRPARSAIEPPRALLRCPFNHPPIEFLKVGLGTTRDLNAICHACGAADRTLAAQAWCDQP
jgi:hypothetical protein